MEYTETMLVGCLFEVRVFVLKLYFEKGIFLTKFQFYMKRSPNYVIARKACFDLSLLHVTLAMSAFIG